MCGKGVSKLSRAQRFASFIPTWRFAPRRSDPRAKHLLPKPKLPNVNLLLGENATGKTTVLQAIVLAALGRQPETLSFRYDNSCDLRRTESRR